LPSFSEELVSSQRGAVRAAALLAAGLLVAFAGLDRLLWPQAFLPLLGVRAAVALCLVACARMASEAHPMAVSALAVALISFCIEVAVLATGGASSPYLYAILIVQAGVSMLVPLRPPS
jgi:hypothetical protein